MGWRVTLFLVVSSVCGALAAIAGSVAVLFVFSTTGTGSPERVVRAAIASVFVISYAIGAGIGYLGMLQTPQDEVRKFWNGALTILGFAAFFGFFPLLAPRIGGEPFFVLAALPGPMGIALSAAWARRR